MSSVISEKIQDLAKTFATSVVAAVRSASVEEIAHYEDVDAAPVRRSATKTFEADEHERGSSPKSRTLKGKIRMARRTPDEIAASVGKVASLLKSKPAGMRSEQIRMALGLQAKEMPRILGQGVASKQLRVVSGQKRATTYGVRGGGGAVRGGAGIRGNGTKVAKKSTKQRSK